MNATWEIGINNSLKVLGSTELYKLFKLPKFSIVLPSNSFYDRLDQTLASIDGLSLDKCDSKSVRADVAIFLCNLSVPENRMEWIWYSSCGGGSAISLGPGFTQDPKLIAQQIGFWVPLEQWCRFPQNQLKFKKGFTLTFIVDEDNVPNKLKRIWIKKCCIALMQYQQPAYEPFVPVAHKTKDKKNGRNSTRTNANRSGKKPKRR